METLQIKEILRQHGKLIEYEHDNYTGSLYSASIINPHTKFIVKRSIFCETPSDAIHCLYQQLETSLWDLIDVMTNFGYEKRTNT